MAQTQNARQPAGYMIAERREQKRRECAISRSRYLWATGRHVILEGGWRQCLKYPVVVALVGNRTGSVKSHATVHGTSTVSRSPDR
ncbi:hypothetical protein TNCV_3773101 [Trichonephila clavipes]|nr:hypothetical protein TNCV_3773101 [Trichonephila clavipes]